MWITSYLAKNRMKDSACAGSIMNADVTGVEVDSSRRYREVPVAAPYGVYCVPPSGERAVMVHTPSGGVCMGVISPLPASLEAGEIMLCSQGGASIVLKNDGSVLINGKEYGGT